MPSVSDVAVERISLSIFQALYEELERLSNLISTAKLQHQNSDVNTLRTSVLANKMEGLLSKNRNYRLSLLGKEKNVSTRE